MGFGAACGVRSPGAGRRSRGGGRARSRFPSPRAPEGTARAAPAGLRRRAWGPRRPRADGCGGVCGCVAWRKIHARGGRGALSVFAKNQVKIKGGVGGGESAFPWKSERRFSAFRNFARCFAPHEARGPGRLRARSRLGHNQSGQIRGPLRSGAARNETPKRSREAHGRVAGCCPLLDAWRCGTSGPPRTPPLPPCSRRSEPPGGERRRRCRCAPGMGI